MKRTHAFLFALLLCCLALFAACNETPNTTSTETNPSTTTDTPSTPSTPENPIVYSSGLAYEVNEDSVSCTITGMGTCTDTEINIPKEIDGYSVTSIGNAAFKNCTSLTSITIPDSVTSIDHSAFRYCTAITSITIPDSVTSIGDYAFQDCPCLAYNEYNNAYYLGNNTNPYLVLVKVKTTSIVACDIHNNTKLILNAFSGCTSLTSITIPDGMTSIGDSAFNGCTSLTNITIPDSVIRIGGATFSGCTSLTSITIPDSVMSIGGAAFSDCTNLTSITIPDGVTSIGYYAFYCCTNLTSITIPDSVTEINQFVFYNCDNLKAVYYGGTAAEWSNIEIGSIDNESLTSATRYYYSETQPTAGGNYWHYVDGVPTAW